MRKGSAEAEDYKKLIGHAAKAEFRRKWCEAKLQEAQKLQIQEKRHTITESTNGSYLSFRKIWEAEGLDEEGFKALQLHQTNTGTMTCRVH
jgi:3-oxoacyl-[acyl-carrier-protein] synthase III